MPIWKGGAAGTCIHNLLVRQRAAKGLPPPLDPPLIIIYNCVTFSSKLIKMYVKLIKMYVMS